LETREIAYAKTVNRYNVSNHAQLSMGNSCGILYDYRIEYILKLFSNILSLFNLRPCNFQINIEHNIIEGVRHISNIIYALYYIMVCRFFTSNSVDCFLSVKSYKYTVKQNHKSCSGFLYIHWINNNYCHQLDFTLRVQ